MKTAAVHPALLPFLCGSLVDARPQAAAGLFEQLTAKEGDPPTFILCTRPHFRKGVWATRPHLSCVPAHIHPATRPHSSCDPPTFILCTRPHLSCVPAKEGESPSLLWPLISDEAFFEKCFERTVDALRDADEEIRPFTT